MTTIHKDNWKLNKYLSFKYMTVQIGNLTIDIPLSLPINYQSIPSTKRAVIDEIEEYQWIFGSNQLLSL